MDHNTTPPKSVVPRDLDTSPVFFTGLSKNVANSKPMELHCKVCNGNLNNTNFGDLCSRCGPIASEYSEHTIYSRANQSNISESSPSCSKNTSISPNDKKDSSILSTPVFNSSLNSSLQNELVESSIQSLLNSDIKALLNSVQIPKQESGSFKSKSSWRERQESRSIVTPYPATPKFHQYSNHKIRGPYHRLQPVRNGRLHTNYGSPVQLLNTPSSFKRTFPDHEPYVQLSRDMWQLYHENKQTEDVKNKKMILRDTLHDILRKQFDCALYVVGSSMTGLGAKSSDIDMCLMLTDSEIDQKKEALSILQAVRKLFRSCKFLRQIQLIPAKVPILRFIDSVSGVEVDLNINNAIGIRNTQLLSSYARIDGRVAPLVILVKLWARHYDINDAARNSLSSYSIVLMVIHYLQYRCQPPVVPCLQVIQPDKYLPNTDVRNLKLYEDLPAFISENSKDLGDLFVGFLNYFGNEFDYSSVMSVRLGLVIPKEEVKCNLSPNNKKAHWKHVCIEEPFDLTNTARSVFDERIFNKIQFAFYDSWRRLMENPDLYYILS